jgi:nitroimidazol reductase NimA-like FMN-containing flavoprotein (pyridoxamine 5'-phosphate oxidase superfamily)
MKYDNTPVRRQDRLMEEPAATALLQSAEYGVLSMWDTEQACPYAVPVNYVWDGTDKLYIHCAPEGRKLRCIEQCADVSFCVVGRVHLLPSHFTTEYESIVMKGHATIGLSDEEKMQALHLIVDKLSADYKDIADKYIKGSFHRVDIIRVEITEWSGKCKKVKVPQK